ncbi:hypothetical protein RIF23_08055 [Lipingzhangella sp. LS1_29]|uniref:Integral membrane protein n=1 Tax=Lipingzhangella rawalii TaxID=2055835 RepID=A0ABU2H6I7_9ACTN|nr:hypothetical protein [Lipingzhangella rawalii]MDS1270244.1 hypothetical protein [Lipingzhangella rawalii]
MTIDPHPTTPDVVELRIHGVSGGVATELLDVVPVKRVGGDELAGFFQRRTAADAETRPGVRREVFAWGNLTSGTPTRALWLLLFPFLLVNLAYWMRPRRLGPGASRRHLWANHGYGAVVRLLALSLTALLITAAAGIGMDLVAWQCAGYGTDCAELRPWLGFLAAPGAPLAQTGTALVVGAVLPLLVLVVLWRLSRRTGGRFEAVCAGEEPHAAPRSATGTTVQDDPNTPAPIAQHPAPLSHPDFWRGYRLVGGLRCLHIALACCVIAALLITAPLGWDHEPAARLTGFGLALLLAILTTCCVALVAVPDSAWHGWADPIGRWVRNLALAAVLAAAGYAALWPRPTWTPDGSLPGLATLLTALFTIQAVLVLILAVLAIALYRGSRARATTAMRGMAGPAAALLGLFLGGVFSAALGTQVPEWLGGCLYPGAEQAGCLAFTTPVVYPWLQLTLVLVAATTVVVLPLVWLLERRRHARAGRLAARTYTDWTEHPQRQDRVTRAIAHGQLTERLPLLATIMLVPVLALTGTILVAAVGGWLFPLPPDGGQASLTPQALGTYGPGWLGSLLAWLVPAGSLLGALLLGALVWLGRAAYQDKPTRQMLGIVWDIGTFWPRGAHPLAPPCYTERAVPQLVCRVTELTRSGSAVLFSGHSQGSVLAAAAVWQLPHHAQDRVALLTHGSPLYRLYARYFPSYFGPAALDDLATRISHWRNLWRATDAIGGPIHLSRETIPQCAPLPDPRALRRAPGEALPPPISGHAWYTRDAAYASTLWELVRHLCGWNDSEAQVSEGETSIPEPRSQSGTGHSGRPVDQ